MKKYFKTYSEMSPELLKNEKFELQHEIKICEEYMKTAHNTFLGTLGASMTLKDCQKRIECIDQILKFQ